MGRVGTGRDKSLLGQCVVEMALDPKWDPGQVFSLGLSLSPRLSTKRKGRMAWEVLSHGGLALGGLFPETSSSRSCPWRE